MLPNTVPHKQIILQHMPMECNEISYIHTIKYLLGNNLLRRHYVYMYFFLKKTSF